MHVVIVIRVSTVDSCKRAEGVEEMLDLADLKEIADIAKRIET
jgi:hypothetical protein